VVIWLNKSSKEAKQTLYSRLPDAITCCLYSL